MLAATFVGQLLKKPRTNFKIMEQRKTVTSYLELLNNNHVILKAISGMKDQAFTRYLFQTEKYNEPVAAKDIKECHNNIEAALTKINKLVSEAGQEFFTNLETNSLTSLPAYKPYEQAKKELKRAWAARVKFKNPANTGKAKDNAGQAAETA